MSTRHAVQILCVCLGDGVGFEVGFGLSCGLGLADSAVGRIVATSSCAVKRLMNSNRNAQLILYKARQSVRRRCRRRRGSVAQLLALFAAFRVSFFLVFASCSLFVFVQRE